MLTEEEFNNLSKDEKAEYLRRSKGVQGLEDLEYFCHNVLGYDDIDPEVHGELIKRLTNGSRKKLILLPRGSFKSSISTICWPIWSFLKNPDIRILIDSEVLENSQKFVNQIKTHLGNPEFKVTYGNLLDGRERLTAREFTVSSRENRKLKEPTVYATGIGTVNVGMHYDLIIADDLHSEKNVGTKEQIDKVIAHYRLLLSLLEPNGQLVVIGCLVSGTKVLMANMTWKEIQQITVDEEVMSWDTNGIMAKKKVEAVIPQGEAEVWELRTSKHRIQATGNHPFLVGKEFIRLDKLKVGDRITGLENLARDLIDSKEAWALGFMFGDGWVTRHPNSKGCMRWATCVAKSEYDDLNKKITGFFEGKFKTKKLNQPFKFKETKFGYYRTEVAAVGRWLESVGFKGRAKTKRIPEHIFNSSLKIRKEFMEGFVAADGYEDKHRRYNIEICNKDLIEDFRRLLSMSGYRPTNIYSRSRPNLAPHSKPGQISTSHHISFSKFPKDRPAEFVEYEIKEIKKIGRKEVWDLTVADTHNFIAEGLVTHNTRWHFADLYDYILEEEPEGWDIYIEKAIRKDGSLFFPNRLTKEFLDEMRRAQSSYLFSCNPYEAPVLMADWTCKPIGEIKIGDEVVGFTIGAGPKNSKLVKTTVVGTGARKAMIVRVVTDKGRVIRCTPDHKWWTKRSPEGNRQAYLPAKVGRSLQFVCDPHLRPVIDGWLGGIFDGEGSCPGRVITLTQSKTKNFLVYQEIERRLKANSFDFGVAHRQSGAGEGAHSFWLKGGLEEKRRFLLTADPVKKDNIVRSLYGSKFAKSEKVVKIESDGYETVYSFQTETGNYIVWGFASKNCQYQNEPISEETQAFRKEYFKYWGNESDLYPTQESSRILLNLYLIIDRAFSTKDSADYTGIVVAGVSSSNSIYVLEAERKKCGLQVLADYVDKLIEKYGQSRFRKFAIETINFEETQQFFIEHMRKVNKHYILERLVPQGKMSKEGRIREGLQARYANGAVFHRKRSHIDLEDELMRFPNGTHDDLCLSEGTLIATLFGDKKIEDIKIGEYVLTPLGIRRVTASACTGEKPIVRFRGLRGTGGHPIFADNQFLPMDTLTLQNKCDSLSLGGLITWKYQKALSSMERPIGLWGKENITFLSHQPITGERVQRDSMLRFGNFIIKGQFLKGIVFIIRMAILLITTLATWSVYRISNMLRHIGSKILRQGKSSCGKSGLWLLPGINQKQEENGTAKTAEGSGLIPESLSAFAGFAAENLRRLIGIENFVLESANINRNLLMGSAPNVRSQSGSTDTGQNCSAQIARVYNLTVDSDHCYYANNLLVGNCDALAWLPLLMMAPADMSLEAEDTINYEPSGFGRVG